MAFQAVWSVDVGKSSLKAVKVQRERNSLEILAVDKIDYPVEASGINSIQHAKDALATFSARNEINCPIVASHPGHSAFSRFIQLPPVDEKKLEEMIGYEAQQQIPFPIDEVVWDYHVCSENSTGSSEREVGIFAVRKEVVSDFMIDYESAGLPVDMISIGYLGLLNYVMFDIRPDKPSVVIDIGSDHTDLLVVDGHRFWVRNLAIAGNDITQTLMDKFKLQFDEAEKLKVSAAKSDQAVKIFGVIQPILKELVNEIHRSVGFYKSQAGDVKFEDVYLFGNTARLLGIQKYLQEQLRFRVHVAKGFSRIRVNRESNVALLQHDFPSFVAAVGNAIQGLGSGEADVNLMPQEQKEALEFRRKQKLVLIAAACLFIVPLVWWIVYGARINAAEKAKAQTASFANLSTLESQIKKLETTAVEEVSTAFEAVRRTVAHRELPAVGLSVLAETLAKLPNARVVSAEAQESAVEVVKGQVAAEMEDLNQQKLWVLHYEVELGWRDAAGKYAPLNAADKAALADPSSCLAYKFTVVGAGYAKAGGAQENQAHVKREIQDPLEQALVARFGEPPFAEATWVRGEPADLADPSRIFMQHPGFQDRQSGGPKTAVTQGTFEPFKLTWYLQDPGSVPKLEGTPGE
ncbi:MAG: type IV pilus assembly protein PilM [Planctomycetota bacterium]